MNNLLEFLDKSKTAYHAHDEAVKLLLSGGFEELKENLPFKIKKGGKYFISRDGSAIIAFTVGEKLSFNIVASHADSPCFKIKSNPEIKVESYCKLNVERYGGGLNYSFLDIPLTIAGRVILTDGKTYEAKTFTSKKNFVIPSVAIHFNRTANDGIKLNPQIDMSPIVSAAESGGLSAELKEFAGGKQIADCDLFVVSAVKPFVAGYNDELICSPRIDNLTSAYSSLVALIKAAPKAINVCYIADNEEVGSATKQGAGSTFLHDVLKRITAALGKSDEYITALANSFILSDDNAHALHPNHPELSDPTNKVLLGKGVVIKHHANQNYTTDGFSSAIVKGVFDDAGVKYQDFYMRSDLPCGGTLGAISSSQVSVRSADIGIAQLAMHSACETACFADYEEAVKGLTAFYSKAFIADGSKKIIVE